MIKILYFILLLFILLLSSCKDNRTDYQKANDYFSHKDYKKAIVYFKKSLKDGIDDNASLFKKLGVAYLDTGHLREGEAYIKKAMKISPDDNALMSLYSDVLIKRKKYYEASYLLKKLPDSFNKYYSLAHIYFLGKNLDLAFKNLEKSITYLENDEDKIKYKYDFAKKVIKSDKNCIAKNKIFDELYVNFKEDINFLKNYYNALNCKYENTLQNRSLIGRYNKNLIKREQRRLEVLKSFADKVSDKYYYNELAQIYIDKKDFLNARRYINESKVIEYNQNKLLFLEAQIDFERERYKMVIEKLTKYLKKERKVARNTPQVIKALTVLAESEYLTNNNFSAIKHYNELVKLDKYNKENLYKLKTLYEKTGNKKALIDIKYKIKFFYRKFYK